jgi:hypothetical protein
MTATRPLTCDFVSRGWSLMDRRIFGLEND